MAYSELNTTGKNTYQIGSRFAYAAFMICILFTFIELGLFFSGDYNNGSVVLIKDVLPIKLYSLIPVIFFIHFLCYLPGLIWSLINYHSVAMGTFYFYIALIGVYVIVLCFVYLNIVFDWGKSVSLIKGIKDIIEVIISLK